MAAEKQSPDAAEQNTDATRITGFRKRVLAKYRELHPEREDSSVDFQPWNPPREKSHPRPAEKIVKSFRVIFDHEKSPWTS